MFKFSLAALLLITATASFANNTGQTGDAAEHSVRNFPVIVKNEIVANGVCKLHFEDGHTREVTCKKSQQPNDKNAGLASL